MKHSTQDTRPDAMTGAEVLDALIEAGFGGWTQLDIARHLGMSQAHLHKWICHGIGPKSCKSPATFRELLRVGAAKVTAGGGQWAAGESLSIHTPAAIRATQREQHELDQHDLEKETR